MSVEFWPDMSEYAAAERYPAPGFTYDDGRPADLFSSDNAATVLRHFQWMRDYEHRRGVGPALPGRSAGGPVRSHYPSSRRVINHVIQAAQRRAASGPSPMTSPHARRADLRRAHCRLEENGRRGDLRTRVPSPRAGPSCKSGASTGTTREPDDAETANRLIDFFMHRADTRPFSLAVEVGTGGKCLILDGKRFIAASTRTLPGT